MKRVGRILVTVAAISIGMGPAHRANAFPCMQPTLFGPALPYTTGPSPTYMVTGDFNEDGMVDIAVGNIDLAHTGANSSVAILLCTGVRTYAPAVQYPVPADPIGLTTGDFDEDGIADLAVASTRSHKISILLGKGTGSVGDGTFASPVIYPAGAAAFHVVTVDLNNDGILDLAVTSDSAPRVSVFRGLGTAGIGDGTFASPVAFALNQLSTGITSADFNGDNFPDLAVTESSAGTVAVMLGTGAAAIGPGSFAPTVHYPAGAGPFEVTAFDFNGDTILDLGVASGNGVFVLKGSASGTFTFSSSINSGISAAVVACDANRDGNQDLAVAQLTGTGGGMVRLYLGNGAGVFGNESLYSIGSDPYELVARDLDNDGSVDLLASAYLTDRIALLPGACLADARAPVLTDVRDVPNDQGGKVFVTWTASSQDVTGGSILNYRVWRRILPETANSLMASSTGTDRILIRQLISPDGTQSVEYWEALATLPAQRLPGYGYTAATTQDSTRRSNRYAAFFVSALTSNIDVFYSSDIDSGYSVDNIPPRGPRSFTATLSAAGAALHWDGVDDSDFAGFRLHRGSEPSFEPSDETLVVASTDTGYVDPLGKEDTYYKLSAIDTHDNESEFALLVVPATTGVTDDVALRFAIHGVSPNPARSGPVAISFALANGSPAKLEMLDLAGRRVFSRSLANLSSGNHRVTVDAGSFLAPGTYLVRLTQSGRSEHAKFVLTQ